METKTCTKCKVERAVREFYKKGSEGGLTARCKRCVITDNKVSYEKYRKKRKQTEAAYREKNRGKIRKKSVAWRKNNPDYAKNQDLLRHYHITLDEYNKMFARQEGCCLACGKHQFALKRALHVDHDHETGKIRGLLCHGCNCALGFVNDNIAVLNGLITYIEEHKD